MESKIVQLKAGDKLCNGVIVTEQLARAYNSLTEQIEGFKALVNLWIGDLLSEMHDDGDGVRAESIKEMVDEMASAATEEDCNGLICDLLNSAIMLVDWHDIASHYQDEG